MEQQKNRNKSQAVNPNQKPAFITGNSKQVVSNNLINRTYQPNNGTNANNRGANQSVKLPKVQTPNSNHQIQTNTNQLPDISVKRSMEVNPNNTTNNIANRIPTSKDSRRRVGGN